MSNSRTAFGCLAIATAITAAGTAVYLVEWYQHTQVWSVVTFEVPDGYRGIFSIVHDPAGGVAPTREPDEEGQSAYRFVIPASGVLRSSTLKPFRHWHKLRAVTNRDKPIPWEGSGEIALRGLGGTGDEVHHLIGTSAERQRWWANSKKWHRIESNERH